MNWRRNESKSTFAAIVNDGANTTNRASHLPIMRKNLSTIASRPTDSIFNLVVSRRGFLTATLVLSTSGCSYSPVIQSTATALSYAIKGMPDVPLTRQQINQIPYATLGAKVGKGPRSLLVLGRIDGDELHWISADRAALVTRHGRLVKSAGFPENLKDTHIVGTDPMTSNLRQLDRSTEWTRLIDLMPDYRYGIPVKSKFEIMAEEKIEILELSFDTILVHETCQAPLLDWEFENRYWVDRQSGFIWKSLQHLAPRIPPISIEIFKPAA